MSNNESSEENESEEASDLMIGEVLELADDKDQERSPIKIFIETQKATQKMKI